MTLTLNTGTFEVVDVPEGYHSIEIEPWANELCGKDKHGDSYIILDLDPHQYQLLGTTSDIAVSEEKAHSIVEKQGHQYTKLVRGVWEDRYSVDRYMNYKTKRWNNVCGGGWTMRIFGALDSFHSLCQLHGIGKRAIWLRKK